MEWENGYVDAELLVLVLQFMSCAHLGGGDAWTADINGWHRRPR
jgi:hypothetical protein